MNNKTDLQILIETIEESFARQSSRSAYFNLKADEWEQLLNAIPYPLKHAGRMLIDPTGVHPDIPVAGLIGAPVIDRTDALKAASMRALISLLENSQLTEPEWRAVLINLARTIGNVQAGILPKDHKET